MIVQETKNHDEIKSILWDKEIYPLISGGVDIDAANATLPDSVLYIGGYNPEIFAVGCFHVFMDGLKFHPNILPGYRLEHARDFIQKCLSMVKSTLYIEFPSDRKDLLNLGLKNGFNLVPDHKSEEKTLMRLL